VIATASETSSAQIHHDTHIQGIHVLYTLAKVRGIHATVVIVYIDEGKFCLFQAMFFHHECGRRVVLLKIHLHIQGLILSLQVRCCENASSQDGQKCLLHNIKNFSKIQGLTLSR
jgi:hypothetical protein